MLKDEILKKLIDIDGYISGQDISQALGVSRTSVWKSIESLRSAGFTIDSKTNLGYCLRNLPDMLIPETITPHIKTTKLGSEIICLDCVDSTNNHLKNLASSGAKEGTVVISNSQSGGRGRLGRSFISPPGKGIYLSVLLRPPYSPAQLTSLTCFAAVAVCEAIEAVSDVKPGIKWVNDILVGDRKICGILTEMSMESESGQIQYIVIGVGVNVLQNADDFPGDVSYKASSLSMLGCPGVSRSKLAAEMINALDRMYDSLPNPDEKLWQKYREKSMTIGRDIRVISSRGTRDAFAEDIDPDGGLIVRYTDGSRETLSYGEISVRGRNGYV